MSTNHQNSIQQLYGERQEVQLGLGPGRRRGRLRRGPGDVLEAAGPDVPPHLHRRHLLQAQLRRRGHPDRPRHQPQRGPHPLLRHRHVHPLRRRAPRLGSRRGRLAAAALLPAAAPPRAPQRPPARPTRQELRGRRGPPGDAAGLHRRHRRHRQGAVVEPRLQGPRRQPRHRRSGLPRCNWSGKQIQAGIVCQFMNFGIGILKFIFNRCFYL